MADAQHMKDFWNARAKENAEYFVDNRLDYNHGDLEAFWRQGVEDLATLLQVVDAPAFRPTDRVLDIGCGVGRLCRALVPQVGSVTGIDISAEMVERARVNLEGMGVDLHVGDGLTLRPLADGAFDAVVSHVVFQHIPDPQVTLGYVREIGRVLVPGGWAVFQISNDPAIHAADAPQPSKLRQLLGRAPKGQSDPAWKGSWVDLDELRAAADDGGLDVSAVDGAGTQYCIVRLTKR